MKIWVLNPPFHPKYSRPQRSPAVTKSGTVYFPIWLAYCVGVLEDKGHSVTFTDAPGRGYNINDIRNQALKLKPELIVMDTSTPSIENDVNVADQLKKILPGSFVVLVGTHVSACAEETLQKSESVDAVARREYEYTVLELASLPVKDGAFLLNEDGLKNIAGLSFRLNGKIIHNQDRPFIKNLDELPWVSRVYKKHLQICDYFNPNAVYPMVTLLTSRGCSYRCSFCVYPQTLTGRKFRFRSINDIIGEMEYVIKNIPAAKSIFFEDDTLTAGKKRCLEFADAIIKNGIKIPWVANSRIDIDLEIMQKIRSAGCRHLCVGFENGNQRILDEMGKKISVEQMFSFVKNAKKAGLGVHGCFMVGFPGETLDDFEKTVKLAKKLSPDTIQFYPVMVYPGTEAFDEYKQRGWLKTLDYNKWITPEGLHNCVVKNETLTPDDLVYLCDEARRKFYLRPRYIAYKLFNLVKKPSDIICTAKAARTFFKHLVLGSRVPHSG